MFIPRLLINQLLLVPPQFTPSISYVTCKVSTEKVTTKKTFIILTSKIATLDTLGIIMFYLRHITLSNRQTTKTMTPNLHTKAIKLLVANGNFSFSLFYYYFFPILFVPFQHPCDNIKTKAIKTN